jgi:hypothetical protein
MFMFFGNEKGRYDSFTRRVCEWKCKAHARESPRYGLPKPMILKEMEATVKNQAPSGGVCLFYTL